MTFDEIRLECLRLAMSLAKERPSRPPSVNTVGVTFEPAWIPPTPAQVIRMALDFEAFVTGQSKPAPEPGAIAKAIDDVLRNKVPSLVKDAMGAAYDP
jgi:hypothetical protein